MADGSLGHLTRTCTSCKVAMPATLEFFPPHKPGKYGLHSWCIPCKKKIDTERRNRPDQKLRQQTWRDNNKAYVKAYNEEYRKDHPSTPYVAAWRLENLEHVRAYCRERNRRYRETDPAYLLKGRMSARISAMLSPFGGKRGSTTEQIVGYTKGELKRHIERQFTKGMSWDKMMKGMIEIDHIIPVSSFNITSYDDPLIKVCWGLANLRPMWSKDNRSKGKKLVTLL